MVLGESPSFLANSACDKPICLANNTKSFGGMPLRIEAISVDGFAARLSGLAAAGILAGLMPGYGRGVSISAVVMDYYKVCFGQMQFCILRDAILQWRAFSHAHPNLPLRGLPALTKKADCPPDPRPQRKTKLRAKKP